MSKQVRLSYVLKPLYFLFFAILLEMVNFLWLDFRVTGNLEVSQVMPKYFFLDFGFLLFIAGIIFLSKRKLANVFLYIFIGLQVLVNIVNATLYKVFGDIFSFDMMKLGGEALAAFKFQFIDFWSIIVNFLILGALITLQIILDRKLRVKVKLKALNKKAFLILAFFICWISAAASFSVQTLTFNDTKNVSNKVSESDQYLWDNMHFKLEAYKKFGTWGFYIKSLSNLIYKQDNYNKKLENELLASLSEGEQEANITAPLYGDNLIVIMLESFEWFAIDPFNTPTLWEIRTQSGISMENFHGKNKTNISEGIGILGNMPKDVSVDYLASNNYLSTPYTLPNLFKEQGYSANYFHGYKKSFYDRNVVNKAMGFEHVYGIEDANIENKSKKFNDWNLDSDYVKSMIDVFAPTDKQFMTFYTTITTHGTYARKNKRFKEYYETYDNNLEQYKAWLSENTSYVYPKSKDLASCYRQYKCAAMDTDRMVEYLIGYLKENNMMQNTTLVLYSDHNCYYEDLYFNIKGTSKADYNDIYNYNIPFMIYSEKLQPQIINAFTNTYDIYPTICELFGLPYNKAITQGYNVFDEEIENSVMVSYLSGAFNDMFYTLNIVDMFVTPDATQDDLNKFKRNASMFYEKQHDLELMYKYGLLVR